MLLLCYAMGCEGWEGYARRGVAVLYLRSVLHTWFLFSFSLFFVTWWVDGWVGGCFEWKGGEVGIVLDRVGARAEVALGRKMVE